MSNSFIEMKLEYTLRLNEAWIAATDFTGLRTVFIGFKNSLEALGRYDIYVDSTKIYSQAWMGEESFIFHAGISENVRRRNPWTYTTWEAVKNMSEDVCGVYVNIGDAARTNPGDEIKVTIPVKINLHQILMLASVRYLPSFCGKWEIELYPSWDNLVIAPIPPETILLSSHAYNTKSATEIGKIEDLRIKPGWRELGTIGFVQLGKKFKIALGPDSTHGLAYVDKTISGADGVCNECLCSLTTFQLRYEVYESLRQMYVENMLVIPTNILQYGRFSGIPSTMDDGTPFHCTLKKIRPSGQLRCPFGGRELTFPHAWGC
jgi:hypothetical protein